MSLVEVQGHRGYKAKMAENSIEGFLAAGRGGADVIELDLRMSCDDVLVIYHDFFLDRTDLKPHLVYHVDADELIFRYQIATFENLLIVLKSDPSLDHLILNLDLKIETKEHPDWMAPFPFFAEKVIEMVERYEFEKRVRYGSFDLPLLREIRALRKKATLNLITTDLQKGLKEVKSIKAAYISPLCTTVTQELIQKCHHQQIKVTPWTVNDPVMWKQLIDWSVDGLITDDPIALKIFLS